MNGPGVVATMLVSVSVLATPAAAAPQDEAIARYRQYNAAIREGQVEKVLKLVEPVPERYKPLLRAYVSFLIAIEAVKKEITAQWGPPKPEDEEADIGGQLSDELLEKLEAVVQDRDTVDLRVNEPTTGAGRMVRRNGEWVVAAFIPLDLETGQKVTELGAEEHAQRLRYAEAAAKATGSILKRLRNKEFMTRTEASDAVGDELDKAAGP